jgi:hypothetical protein
MDTIFGFLKVLVICGSALTALFIILIVLINFLPRSPLRDILGAVSGRIGVTAAITVVSIPVDFVPGVDVAYDVISLIFLIWYWLRIIKVIEEAYSR